MSEGQDHGPPRPGFIVTVEPSGALVRGEPGQSLFHALRAAGVPVGSACRGEGVCGRCAMWVEPAATLPPPTDAERAALLAARAKEGQRLSCLLNPQGSLRARASYW